jgi:hypothetical protein
MNMMHGSDGAMHALLADYPLWSARVDECLEELAGRLGWCQDTLLDVLVRLTETRRETDLHRCTSAEDGCALCGDIDFLLAEASFRLPVSLGYDVATLGLTETRRRRRTDARAFQATTPRAATEK